MSDFMIAFYFYNFVWFAVGVIYKNATLSSQEQNERFGFRIIYLLVPSFFLGYYLSNFLFKDWTKK